ncbi:MAG: DUF501 domain-containing protein, partial [Acidipropionibacterium acidipropionici]|nr:DUF501 domain-containing protein [Acidipropionibacterium acidipropionici]
GGGPAGAGPASPPRPPAAPAGAAGSRAAHESYLADRARFGARAGLEPVTEIDGVSAGGMPTRVKCLHALAAHSLAVGPGVNPFGDEVVEMLGLSWSGEAEGTGTSEKENS